MQQKAVSGEEGLVFRKSSQEEQVSLVSFNSRAVVDFLTLCARLKSETRHCCDETGLRQESVAEHCFQMTLFALTVSRYLENQVDVLKLIKLCICHDLAEVVVGDTPYVDGADRAAKRTMEEEGLERLLEGLSPEMAQEIRELWLEYEECKSLEARCAKALDNLEAQLQHNIAPLSTWEEREFPMVFTKIDKWCAHDAALKALCETIKADACSKMLAAGVDPDRYRT